MYHSVMDCMWNMLEVEQTKMTINLGSSKGDFCKLVKG